METTSKKAKAFSMTTAALEKLGAKMDQLPQASGNAVNSRMAALIMLRPHINKMREKGYDYAQISAWLADNTPLSVSPSTIRTALSKARSEEAETPKKVTKLNKPKSEPVQPETAPVSSRAEMKPEPKPSHKPSRSTFGDDRV
jgi:hypothetical protein